MQRDIAREQQLIAEAKEISTGSPAKPRTITAESESGEVAEEAGRERLASAEAALSAPKPALAN